MSNPIAESIDYLVECGWEREQARNLVAAITDDSGERLWEAAPKWIEHCGDSMRYVNDMLGSVAVGLIEVRLGEDNKTWLFKLNDQGMGVGKKLTEENKDGHI
jgi:hypothetical protein